MLTVLFVSYYYMKGQKGPDVEALSFELAEASRDGKLHDVRSLIVKGASVTWAEEGDGATALMWACEKGHADVVAELIASGSNVNHQEGGSGFSALMVVAFRGHFEIAKMLLDAGAELGFKNKVWASPQRRCRACASALTRTPTLTCVRSRRCARLRFLCV